MSLVIHPDLEPNDKEPAGAPNTYSSFIRFLGKIYTGGNEVPVAFTIPIKVTKTPLSALAICPTCFFPVLAIILEA